MTTRGDTAAGLEWVIRCVCLFDEFPHPATGPAPAHLARLYRLLGRVALDEGWQRIAGTAAPDEIVAALEAIGNEGNGGTRHE